MNIYLLLPPLDEPEELLLLPDELERVDEPEEEFEELLEFFEGV